MIFVDTIFAPALGLEGCKAIDGLEKECGAQIVVSKRMFPPTGELLSKHIEDGSVFIVVSNQWSNEIPVGIYKVSEIGAKAKYHIVIGVISCADNGEAIRDESKYYALKLGEYSDYTRYMARISSFGFSALNIESEYLGLYVSEINELIGNSVLFMPTDTYEFMPIRDWRATLSAIPSVGAKRAQALYESYTKDGEDPPPFIDVLVNLTDYDKNKRPISKVVCAGTRAWLGIPDGFNLSLEVLDSE